MIVGVLTSFGEATQVLELAVRPFDIIEWRLDLTGLGTGGGRWLERCHDLEQAGIPVLLTIRSSAEGGKWLGDETDRMALFRHGVEVVSTMDIEINSRLLTSVIAEAHRYGKTVIGSFHDFHKTPPHATLGEILQRGWCAGADVVKVATKLNRPDDLDVLCDLQRTATPPRPVCMIGMGPPAARLALAQAGACFVYGFLGKAAVPGQLACEELWRQLVSGGGQNEKA